MNNDHILRRGLLSYFSEAQLMRIEACRVGIAGAGGLGSNCAMNLVRSGFKNLTVVDFDLVEPPNLNRQFFFPDQVGMPKVEALRDNLMRLNPHLELKIHNERVTAENAQALFHGCTVIVEAFDLPQEKQMLVERFYHSQVLLIAASGLAGWQDSDFLVTRKINHNFYVVGDAESETGPGSPPCAPRVGIAAAKQANLILAHALGEL